MQDRLAETERLKKEFAVKTIAPSSPPKSVFDGIGGVTLVTSNDSTNLKEKLGKVRNSGLVRRPNEFRPRTADPKLSALTTTNNNSYSVNSNNNNMNSHNDSNSSSNNINNSNSNNSKKFGVRSNSMGQNVVPLSCFENDNVSSKFLTESATVSIPVSSNQNKIPVVGPPKYKTMPSPTRTSTILPESNCLNEIFEEGTDVGSSDTSATNTPRPITRHSTFTNNRPQGSANSSSQRRSKFHKTRTTSCSSSDDDDSENRKKRAHKIVDSTKPFTPQRRDSHDDSSDSQDPSNGATAAGTNSSSQCPVQVIVGTHAQEHDSVNQVGDGNTNGRQNKIGFRRHRAGRRRAGETRLRESQSLNRITEVQESEFSLAPLITIHPNDKKPTPSPSTSSYATVVSNNHKTKMGFGARFFQGFRKTDPSTVPAASNSESRIPSPHPETRSNGSADEHSTSRSRSASRGKVEMALEVELAKALKVTTESKGSSAAKKLKMLGRYFQVNIQFFYRHLKQ